MAEQNALERIAFELLLAALMGRGRILVEPLQPGASLAHGFDIRLRKD